MSRARWWARRAVCAARRHAWETWDLSTRQDRRCARCGRVKLGRLTHERAGR